MYICIIYTYICIYVLYIYIKFEQLRRGFSRKEKGFSLVSTLQSFSSDITLYLSNLQKLSLFDVIKSPDVLEVNPEPQ